MGPETVNRLNDSEIHGDFVGRDKITNIIMFQESEREFVVTHNASIKPVSYFTGRETELQELRTRIEAGRKSVLVSGMGGIGKTHICRKLFEEYLKRHAEDKNGSFRHIGYIEYNGDMSSSLQNCLKFKQQESPEQNREAAWRELEYLAADGKLLLFIDNVDKTIGADPGLQRLKGIPGAVILTSRQTSLSDEFEPYRIGFLAMGQCVEIYEKIRSGGSGKKIDSGEVEDLEYVIENLAGRHTITVELLAHLARTRLWTVKRLREELEKNGFRLMFHKDGDLVNIQESYEKLYDLSGLTEAEQNILEAFSVFPYIPLAAETCNEWLLADAGVSEADDILMGLYQKGWLQFDMEKEGYALHPVFAQFIYEKCKPRLKRHSALVDECQRRLKIPESGSTLECQKFIPFAENIVEKLDIGKTTEQADFISNLAYLLQYVAEYKKAEKLCKRRIEIEKSISGENHLNTAKSYNNLAYVYDLLGEHDKAEELYEKSLKIEEGLLEKNNPEIISSYNNLAVVYEKLGKFGKAKEVFEKNLQIQKSIFGEIHPNIAMTYNNLGYVYEIQENYKIAEELYRKGLYIFEHVLGENHPDTAGNYTNLATLLMKQGEYKEAEKLYQKSLMIYKIVFGERHPSVLRNYCDLSSAYIMQGYYEVAEKLLEKTLQIQEDVLGKNHSDTINSYYNLAAIYEQKGMYEKAEEIYRKTQWTQEFMLEEKSSDATNIKTANVGEGSKEKQKNFIGKVCDSIRRCFERIK